MKNEFENIEEIERYLNGSMQKADREAFENRLASDQMLKEELEDYRKVVSGIRMHFASDLKNQLKMTDLKMDNGGKIIDIAKKSNRTMFWISIAASFTILCLAGYYNRHSFFPNLQIAQYEIREPGLPVLMSGVKNNSFDNAMNAYKTQNYSEAIGLLQSIHNTKPQNDTINYFLGMVFYLENNTKAATPFFENVTDTLSSYYYKSEYQKGICYWKLGEINEAIRIFNTISSDTNNPFNAQSKEILQILK